MLNTIIYKYPIDLTQAEVRHEFEMPMGAEVLTLQMQRRVPCIWVQVSYDEAPTELRHFVLYGTGHVITGTAGEGLAYIGTFQLDGFVGHLFEDTSRREKGYGN